MLSRTILVLISGFFVFVFGCRSPLNYPIGIYGVPTDSLPILAEAGFNTVVGSAATSYLDAAQKNGLKVLAAPGSQAGANFDSKTARIAVRKFDRHPALWSWYLVDEPDLNQVSPDAVRQANSIVKKAGATKPTSLVLYKGSEALHYANIADITMIDRYPIAWQPLAAFSQHVGMVRLALGPKKPLIAVIQAFDWSYFSELVPGETNLRAPTFAELRCMTYLALAERANGLFYYAYDSGGWKMDGQPDSWNNLKEVVKEVNERLPFFEAEPIWWAHQRKFEDGFKGWNEVGQSSINLLRLRVKRGNQHISAGDYILAVNNMDRMISVRFTAPAELGSDLAVFEEERTVNISSGWIKETFEPYAVHIYGPLAVLPKASE